MQSATFYKLEWIKGTVTHVVECESYDKRSLRSSHINDNKFLLAGTPPKLHLTVEYSFISWKCDLI